MTKSKWRWLHRLCGKAPSPPPLPLPELPDDVIIKILSTLPVESLLRLSCVCKNWLDLIYSSHFTKNHLKNAQNANIDDFSEHRVIAHVDKENDPRKMIAISLHSILLKTSNKTPWLIKVLSKRSSPEFIIGSYNGLICYVTELNNIVLWNPIIRERYEVQLKDPKLAPLILATSASYGFLYDENGDDYKILVIYSTGNNRNTKLWSSKTSSWKTFLNFPSNNIFTRRGIAVNEKLHWIVLHNRSYNILAFDLKSGGYEEIPMPMTDYFDYTPILAIFKGMLCVVCTGRYLEEERTSSSIWVRRNFSSVECWRRVCFFPLIETPWPSSFSKKNIWYLKRTFPMFITSNVSFFYWTWTLFRVRPTDDGITRSQDSQHTTNCVTDKLFIVLFSSVYICGEPCPAAEPGF